MYVFVLQQLTSISSFSRSYQTHLFICFYLDDESLTMELFNLVQLSYVYLLR